MTFTPGEIKYIWKHRGNKNYLLKAIKAKEETVESLIFDDIRNSFEVSGKILSSPKEGEAYHWPRLLHGNLAPLLDILSINETVSIYISTVFEKSLKDTIQEEEFTKRLDCLSKKKSYAEDILWALDYLHGKSLCLMNLNEGNIYVSSRNDKAIITDFSCLTLEDRAIKSRVAVPTLYRAPELAASSTEIFYPKAAEMWACGVLMLQIFSDQVESSFEGDPDKYVLKLVQSLCGKLDESSKQGSVEECNAVDEFKIFLDLFLKLDPCSRTTASNAALSSFLRRRKETGQESDLCEVGLQKPELDEECENKNQLLETDVNLLIKPAESVKVIPSKRNARSFVTLEYVSDQEKLNNEKFQVSLRNYITTTDAPLENEIILNETDIKNNPSRLRGTPRTENSNAKVISNDKVSHLSMTKIILHETDIEKTENNTGCLEGMPCIENWNAKVISNDKVLPSSIIDETDIEKSENNSSCLEGMPNIENSNAKVISNDEASHLSMSQYSNLPEPIKNSETDEIYTDKNSSNILRHNQDKSINSELQPLVRCISDSSINQPNFPTENEEKYSNEGSTSSWKTETQSDSSEDEAYSTDSIEVSGNVSKSNESLSVKEKLTELSENNSLHKMEDPKGCFSENNTNSQNVREEPVANDLLEDDRKSSCVRLHSEDDLFDTISSRSLNTFPIPSKEQATLLNNEMGQKEDVLYNDKLLYRNGEICDLSGKREDLKRRSILEDDYSSPLLIRIRQLNQSPTNQQMNTPKPETNEYSSALDIFMKKKQNEFHDLEKSSDVGCVSNLGLDCIVGDFAPSGDTLVKDPIGEKVNKRLPSKSVVRNSSENNTLEQDESEKSAKKHCMWFFNRHGELELSEIDFYEQTEKKKQEKSKFQKKSWFHHFCPGCQTRGDEVEMLCSFYSS